MHMISRTHQVHPIKQDQETLSIKKRQATSNLPTRRLSVRRHSVLDRSMSLK